MRNGSLKLIVRGYGRKGELKEETIREIPDGHKVESNEVEKAISETIRKAFK